MSAKRPVFEEVDADHVAQTARTGRLADAALGARGAIRAWLRVLFVALVALILVGGATRLTDSGLSITEWKPLTGALPPLTQADWQAEFDRYKAIPEYQLQNRGMSLAEFQVIYWWEWGHRQLARAIGLIWAVGFLWFLVRRKIPPGWTGRLLALGVLGGAQGVIGWWMVSSGLVGTRVDVASYRLAVHLGLAFLILGLIAAYIMRLSRSSAALLQARRNARLGAARWAAVLLVLTFLQILIGALVAGIDAGRSFTDWPMMHGSFLPPGWLELQPVWRNFFENPGTVQFVHRMTGYLLGVAALIAWVMTRRSPVPRLRLWFTWVVVVLLCQTGLGIATVRSGAMLWLALAHQLGAVITLVVILRARFFALYPPEQSIRRTAR